MNEIELLRPVMKQRGFRALLHAGLAMCAVSSLLAAQEAANDPAVLMRADLEQRKRWAAEWLASDNPQRVAWGAWLARQDRQEYQTAFIPELLKKVEQYHPDDSFSYTTTEREGHDAMLAVLDALITLRAPVPAEQAHKLYAEFPAQTLILLVRTPDDNVLAMLDVFQRAKANWNWLAAGNVLVKKRPPKFAAALLGRFTQHLTVSIHDPGRVGGGVGIGTSCCYGIGGPKQGWPAVGLYELTQYPERYGTEATFLVSGDTSVYYLRSQPGNYDNRLDVGGCRDDTNRDDYRAQYLMRLLDSSFPRPGLEPYSQLYVSWEGESPYRQQLIKAVNERVALIRRAVFSLQESSLLTDAEAKTLKARLEIMISDQRSDRTTPLPDVPLDDEGVSMVAKFSKPID